MKLKLGFEVGAKTGEDARSPSIALLAKQWPGQARRAAAAVDAERRALKSSHFESSLPQLCVRLGVFFQGQQTLFT